MRFWPRRSTVETRADEAPDDSVADTDGVLHALWSGASSGSVAVTGAEALRVPAVSNAVRVISEAAATLDVRILERGADGVETEDREHPIGILLRGDVNPWSAGFDLIRDLTADALTRDWGGLAYVNRVRGEIREIVRYQQAAISVTYDPWTAEPSYRIDGKLVDSKNILHVRGSFDRCALSLAAEAIGVARQMEKHAGNFFKNGAVPSVVVLNKLKAGEAGAKKQIKGWKETFNGPEASGRTAFLWDDASIQQLMLNSVDSQFLELRKFQILEIANAFRVPPSMLYQLDRATWSNSEQMGREFLTYTLEPWLRSLETALGRALFTREERRRYRISFDRDDLTRADLTARATAISSLVSAKVINPNTARTWLLELAPYEGGNEYGNPHINPNAEGGVPKTGETPPKPDDEADNGSE
jgi:HK97 family phage portal protein